VKFVVTKFVTKFLSVTTFFTKLFEDGSVYSTRCSAAVYREDQWQRRSKHTELES
jgi:hypothetical protein